MELDFTTMTQTELCGYILTNREDETALEVYLDRLHHENPNPRVYKAEEDVSKAISQYLEGLEERRQQAFSMKRL